MNKREKLYFVNKIFQNHINFDDKEEFDRNWEIIHDFKMLDLIPEEIFYPLVDLIREGAKEDSFSAIMTCQELLCKEFNIKVIH